MSGYGRIASAGLMGLVALLVFANPSRADDPNSGQCLTDNAVSAKERAPFEQVALRVAHDFVNADAAHAYDEFSGGLKALVPQTQLDANMQALAQLKPWTTLNVMRVAHTYTVKGSTAPHIAICASTNGLPENEVLVSAKAIPLQAHVIVEGQTDTTTWSFIFWMVPEQGAWRVESFHLLPTTAVGKSAMDFLVLARDQRGEGHMFNAAMFYASARELAFRGPNLQLGIWEDIKKEFADLALPQELKGTPPFLWRFGANAFRVERANAQDINGKLALLIHHDLPAADDAKQVETQNKALITGFVAAYPEIKNAFDAIVAEGVGPKGNGFRTAVDIQK